jgi:hypothetical protein
MKSASRIFLFSIAGLLCIVTIAFIASASPSSYKVMKDQPRPFHNGDIIFQTSQSGQSLAISYATHSKYTHCGLLFNDGGNWYVYEAVGPVKKTGFQEWISHGDSSYYVVRRLIKSDSIMTEV